MVQLVIHFSINKKKSNTSFLNFVLVHTLPKHILPKQANSLLSRECMYTAYTHLPVSQSYLILLKNSRNTRVRTYLELFGNLLHDDH